MQKCIFSNKCQYLNNLVIHDSLYIDNFMKNFCTGYYKKCAIWEISNNLGPQYVPINLLPFQYNEAKKTMSRSL